MDRRERAGDLLAGLLALQESWAGSLYVALPGIIQSYDAAKRTCVVQPAIKAQTLNEYGATAWETMPLLLDCPVIFPQGGGYVLTFPLQPGDECVVHFSDRCIDSWWQSGGVQVQAELRMHDLSDGFVMPGPRSIPNVEGAISTNEVQLRSVDGDRKVRISSTEIEVKTANSGIKCSDNRVDITGILWINGKQYLLHTHSEPDGSTGGINNA